MKNRRLTAAIAAAFVLLSAFTPTFGGCVHDRKIQKTSNDSEISGLEDDLVLDDSDFFPKRPMTTEEQSHWLQYLYTVQALVKKYAEKPQKSDMQTLIDVRKKIVEFLTEANHLYNPVPDDLLDLINTSVMGIDQSLLALRSGVKKRSVVIKVSVLNAPVTFAFEWPIDDFEVTSEFGWRRSPKDGGRQFHDAIDLAASRGTYVFAAAQGKVVFAGYKPRAGKSVIVEHPHGYRTFYAHLDDILAAEGMLVTAGSPIGTVGMTGYTTGPHLHFKITKKDQAVNPRELIGVEIGHDSR